MRKGEERERERDVSKRGIREKKWEGDVDSLTVCLHQVIFFVR